MLTTSSCLLILSTTTADALEALLALLVAIIPVVAMLMREWMKIKLDELRDEQRATRAVIERAAARAPHRTGDPEKSEEKSQ